MFVAILVADAMFGNVLSDKSADALKACKCCIATRFCAGVALSCPLESINSDKTKRLLFGIQFMSVPIDDAGRLRGVTSCPE